SGSAFVTGLTTSVDFPGVAGAAQPTYGGGVSDAFVAKLSPDGASLLFATYLGGSGQDDGRKIFVDDSRSAWLTGITSSPDFPTVGAFQPSLAGGVDGYVARLSSAGNAILYS